jgi:hypothetical protein
MATKYVVWTGTKFKGCWDSKELALRYMAISDPSCAELKLVAVDTDKTINAEVPAMVKQMADEAAAAKAKPAVHHLKAESITATAKGQVS